MTGKNSKSISRLPDRISSFYNRIRGLILPVITINVLFLLGSYVILTYSRLGLILWELAPIIAVLLDFPLTIFLIWVLNTFRYASSYKRWCSVILIASLLIFHIWAFFPCLLAQSLSQDYDQKFENAFGQDYFTRISPSIRKQLAPSPFSLTKLLFLQVPSDYLVEKDIPYGNHSWQVLDIYLPINTVMSPSPAIILIHGESTWEGANKAGTPEVNTAKYFTAQGLVVISIEYRLPEEGNFWAKIFDIRSAIAWIHTNAGRYSLNPDHLFILGRSRGGHLATTAVYSGMNNNTHYQANAGNFSSAELSVAGVIDLYGPVNPYLAEESNFLKERNEIFIGTSREVDPDLYRNVSASYLVSPACPPTLIIHGSLDGLVSPEGSRHLSKALADQNVTVIYLDYPTGEHQFDVLPWTAGGQIMYYFAERFIWSIVTS